MTASRAADLRALAYCLMIAAVAIALCLRVLHEGVPTLADESPLPPPAPVLFADVLPSVVEEAVARYEPAVRARYAPLMAELGLSWPARQVTLLGFKAEKRLEVWVASGDSQFRRLAVLPVLAASGHAGPKRQYGDHQVPEGFYPVTELNPRSSYHLSLRVGYPNDEDIAHARVPRDKMGGDIYVHGGSRSVGCLAMGNAAIEGLFCLVARAAPDQRRVILAPVDLRVTAVAPSGDPWVDDLYDRLRQALADFPAS
jgi:hypothetical protein